MLLDIFVHTPKCAGGTIQNHIETQYPSDIRFGPHNPFYKEKISQVLGFWSRRQCLTNKTYVKRSWINAYLSSLPTTVKNAIRCTYGHAAYYGIHKPFGRTPRYFTFLREPLSRFVSLYNYIRTVRVTPDRLMKNKIQKKDGTFRSVDEWLEEIDLNLYSMSSFLLRTYRAEKLLVSFSSLGTELPNAKDLIDIKTMLASFYFVGLTEDKEDMDFTLGSLGITNFLQDKNVLQKKDTYMKPHNMEKARKIVETRCPYDVELYAFGKMLNLEKKEQISNYKDMVVQTRARRELQNTNNV